MTDMSLEEMKAKIAQMEAANKAERQKIVRDWKPEYEYNVKWLDRFYVDIDRQLTEESKASYEKLKVEYPDCSMPWISTGGMTYILAEGHLFSSGGGLHIIRNGKYDRFHDGGVELTEEEERSLRGGELMPSLYHK